jgi:hypothetical protein
MQFFKSRIRLRNALSHYHQYTYLKAIVHPQNTLFLRFSGCRQEHDMPQVA